MPPSPPSPASPQVRLAAHPSNLLVHADDAMAPANGRTTPAVNTNDEKLLDSMMNS
jgi:hypothetical protein